MLTKMSEESIHKLELKLAELKEFAEMKAPELGRQAEMLMT